MLILVARPGVTCEALEHVFFNISRNSSLESWMVGQLGPLVNDPWDLRGPLGLACIQNLAAAMRLTNITHLLFLGCALDCI